MNDKMLADIMRRLNALERTSARLRIGEVTDIGPLDVALGGSDTSYEDVRSLAGDGLATGDQVATLIWGNDLLVLGPISDGGAHKVALPYGAGWADLGGFDAASYSRVGRLVAVQGVASKTGGTPAGGNVIATLPAGFRPASTVVFATGPADGFGATRVDVNSSGQILWQSGGTSETDYTVLGGIVFMAA